MIKPEIILSILIIVAMIGNTLLIYALKRSIVRMKYLEGELAKKLEGCSPGALEHAVTLLKSQD